MITICNITLRLETSNDHLTYLCLQWLVAGQYNGWLVGNGVFGVSLEVGECKHIPDHIRNRLVCPYHRAHWCLV